MSKLKNVSHPVYLMSYWGSYPWNFVTVVGLKKLVMSFPDGAKILMMCALILIQYEHVTDGQMPWDNGMLFATTVSLCMHRHAVTW